MKTQLCHDAYSEVYVRDTSGTLVFGCPISSLSLLSRLAHGLCAYCNALVILYAPFSMSPGILGECDDEAGQLP